MTLIHRFGDVVVDETRREVRRGATELPAKRRELDVLLYLIHHRDRIVSRDELHDQFWPDLDFADATINACLYRVRQLMRDSTATIRTMRGRGVRLLASSASARGASEPGMGSPWRAELVGRRAETARLSAAVDDVLAGRGGVALVSGEPGIGKTRLIEELIRYSRARGVETLVASCRDGAPAFAPWQDIIAAYTIGRDRGDVLATIGAAAADLGRLVPLLAGDADTAPAAAAPADPEHARVALVEAIAAFLGRAAARQSLVLVVEDLQWADSSSLFLLHCVARALRDDRILIVATHRIGEDTEALVTALDGLRRAPRLTEVALGPLAAADARRLLAQIDADAPEALVRAVVDKAEGNPFFIGECWWHLRADRRAADAPASEAALPATVEAVIGLRLDRLSAPCRSMLDAAAVIGREFDDSLLAEAAALGHEELVDALDEAAQQRVVMAERSTARRWRFAHALICDTAYARLAPPRRGHLHQRVAECLERRASGDADASLALLAHHFTQAGSAGDVEKAIAYSTRAGEQAHAALAYEEAARCFAQALAALERHRPTLVVHRHDLLLSLGDAYAHAGDGDRAAAAYARATEDPAHDIASGTAAVPPSRRNLATALLASAPATSSHARLVTRLNFFLRRDEEPLAGESWHDVRRRREAHTADALARARRAGRTRDLAVALSDRRWVALSPQYADQRLLLSNELVEVAEEIGDVEFMQEARLFRISDLIERGRIDAADAAIATYARVAERDPQPTYAWVLGYLRAMRAQLASRYDEAEELGQAALSLGTPVVGELALAVFGFQFAAVRAGQGRLAEIGGLFDSLLQHQPEQLNVQVVVMEFDVRRGLTDKVRRQLDAIAADDFWAVDAAPGLWINVITGLVPPCVLLGDAGHAAGLYEKLRPLAGTFVVGGFAFGFFGAVDGYLGALAGVMRQWKVATQHFERALAFNQRIGSPGTVAHTQLAYARMLIAKDASASRRRAAALLEGAAATAHTLRMPGLAAEAEQVARG